MRTIICLLGLVLSLAPSRAVIAEPPRELWLYYSTNLLVEKNLTQAAEIWGRAAKAG